MALVSTEWLEKHGSDANVKIADASLFPPNISRDPRAEYREKHLPGAVFFDIDSIKDRQNPLPHMLPVPAQFEREVSALGLGSNDHIVFYDSMGIFGAARAWWMFRAMGHEKVSVLDGGLPKWLTENRATTNVIPNLKPSTFKARFRPELVKDKTTLDQQLADARSPGRHAGTEPEPWAGRRSGRIPGAKNVPFADLLTAEKTMRTPEEILARFKSAGLDVAKPLTCYCGSGVSAAVLALALFTAGHEVPVYDGSWAEWGLPGGGPLESN